MKPKIHFKAINPKCEFNIPSPTLNLPGVMPKESLNKLSIQNLEALKAKLKREISKEKGKQINPFLGIL